MSNMLNRLKGYFEDNLPTPPLSHVKILSATHRAINCFIEEGKDNLQESEAEKIINQFLEAVEKLKVHYSKKEEIMTDLTSYLDDVNKIKSNSSRINGL